MQTMHATSGSAQVQGELWGARAHDYADYQEPQLRPLFTDAIGRTSIGPGNSVLDVGCGPGGFCRLAAETGATVVGIDASQALVEICRERVPAGRFDVGDLQFLPYENDSFDVVTGSTASSTRPIRSPRFARPREWHGLAGPCMQSYGDARSTLSSSQRSAPCARCCRRRHPARQDRSRSPTPERSKHSWSKPA
jgi:Methyltransferase domain